MVSLLRVRTTLLAAVQVLMMMMIKTAQQYMVLHSVLKQSVKQVAKIACLEHLITFRDVSVVLLVGRLMPVAS